MRIFSKNVARARSAWSGKAATVPSRRQGVREADPVRGCSRRYGHSDDPADGLVDGEQRPHLLHDAWGRRRATGCPRHGPVLWWPMTVRSPAQGIGAGQVSAGYSSTSSRSVTRQNTSGDSSRVFCRGARYSMTRTVTGGRLSCGAAQPARYVPSGRTFTGLRANDAEARHRMRAPVAEGAGRDQDRTGGPPGWHARQKQPAGPWQRLLSVGGGRSRRPAGCRSDSAPRPTGPAGRAVGTGSSRPKNAAFFCPARRHCPVHRDHPQPAHHTPGAPSAPVGPATCSNSIAGSAPSPAPRQREMFGSHHWRPCPASTRSPGASFGHQVRAPLLAVQPSASLAITCPYPVPAGTANASTKYTISRV